MRKFNIIAIASAAFAFATAGTAMATPIPVFLTSGTGNQNVSWNGSTLTITDTTGAFLSKNGFFTSNANSSSEQTSIVFQAGSLAVSGNSFTETLGAGTFTTTGPAGTISGSIGAGDTFGGSTVATASFGWLSANADNVTYNPTALFLSSGLQLTGGQFSLTAQTVTPSPFVITGGVLQNFTASDGTEFSANVTSTPEPASIATFGIGAMALMLMGFVARRRNAGSTL